MSDAEREQESRAALDRVRRDSDVLGASAVARIGRRVGAHFAGAPSARDSGEDEPDGAEIWGRRVGRAVSLLVGAVLLWWLGRQLGWW